MPAVHFGARSTDDVGCRPMSSPALPIASSPHPRPPFLGWPIQVANGYGFMWYPRPACIVTQVVSSHGSASMVQEFFAKVDDVLHHCADEVAREGGLHVVHDWRAVRTHDKDLRSRFAERMREKNRGYVRLITVSLDHPSALLRMAVAAVNLVASVSHGGKVELVDDPAWALEFHRIVPPRAGSRFPGS